MQGFSFLITWLVFGIPSSALVVAIEAMTVLSGVFCVAAKNADIRMRYMFEGYEKKGNSHEDYCDLQP